MQNPGRRKFLMSGAALAATSRLSFAQSPRLEIKIVNSVANGLFAFQELLNRQRYLEEFGLIATTVNVGDGVRVMAGLLSGDLDVCMASGFGQVLPAIEKGGAIKVVAGANNLTPQGVMTNRSNIKSMSDLAGKTIGTGPLGALEHQLMVAMLTKHDVDPASVTFVNIGATADIYRAVVAGTVDAGPVNIDRYALQKDDLKIVADMWTDLPDYPYQGSFASTSAITNKRDAIVRTLAAYCKLYRYLQTPESKEPYIDAYLKAVSSAPRSEAEMQWNFAFNNKVYATDLVLPDNKLSFLQDLNIRTNTQKAPVSMDNVLDRSLGRDALKLLGA